MALKSQSISLTANTNDSVSSTTADEIILARMSSNSAIVAQVELLADGRDVIINVSDAGYQSTVNLFESEGVITAERAAEYRQGIPLEVTYD
jgi:uncharacterized Rossmann fold enzyme